MRQPWLNMKFFTKVPNERSHIFPLYPLENRQHSMTEVGTTSASAATAPANEATASPRHCEERSNPEPCMRLSRHGNVPRSPAQPPPTAPHKG
jgi:hypothetical protein